MKAITILTTIAALVTVAASQDVNSIAQKLKQDENVQSIISRFNAEPQSRTQLYQELLTVADSVVPGAATLIENAAPAAFTGLKQKDAKSGTGSTNKVQSSDSDKANATGSGSSKAAATSSKKKNAASKTSKGGSMSTAVPLGLLLGLSGIGALMI